MSKESPVIVYFKQDLRLKDNPALSKAAEEGAPILPIYIIDTQYPGRWEMGGAQKAWLSAFLEEFRAEIPLAVFKGNPVEIFKKMIDQTGAKHVFWNRSYEPFARKRDKELEAFLESKGVEVNTSNGSLLIEPWEVSTKKGTPFKVFTQFWKTSLELIDPEEPLPIPNASYFEIESEKFSFSPKWGEKILQHWQVGEKGAEKLLERFTNEALEDYKSARDIPGEENTSRLSPYLHFGHISPRQIWHKVDRRKTGAKHFISELGWREFSYHLLWHFPHIPERPFVDKFSDFKWDNKTEHLTDWQKGKTGYPIVDAGMRELWETGWMHNRVRMIVASFLTKDLFVHWKKGEEWFWDTLVDADLASNSASWQWVAGSGADAAPYFRVFNPVLQGEKFDPEGIYVKKWVPELQDIPAKWVHKPWEAPGLELRSWGVTLGDNYPHPLVEHKAAREEALKRFEQIKS